MSCYHPLKAFKIGINKETGKDKLVVCSYDTDYVSVFKGKVYKFKGQPNHFLNNWHDYSDFIQIPCGKCIGCRLDYSRQWANRCMLELPYHESSYFITLTYDDEHLPTNPYFNDNGEIIGYHPTLVKEHFQNFMKSLRQHYCVTTNDANKLRFYACGEYGSKYGRPHYHAIIFGLKLDDLKPYKRPLLYSGDSAEYNYYTSETLSKLWKKGYVVVGKVTWETCAYTARYIMKKLNGDLSDIYTKYNFLPEFTLMSRKPGIANQYFKDHVGDIYTFDEINISTSKGGLKIKPPHYYDTLFDIDYPETLDDIKLKRRLVAEELTAAKLRATSLPYLEMLAAEESALKSKVKVLKRKGDFAHA